MILHDDNAKRVAIQALKLTSKKKRIGETTTKRMYMERRKCIENKKKENTQPYINIMTAHRHWVGERIIPFS